MTAHVVHTHTIQLDWPVEQVFPLFTPRGEEAWVDGWRPEYLYEPAGETCRHMIFRTQHDGEETLWACIHWDPAAWTTRYCRIAPASRMGFVDVTCKPIDPRRTRVTISYELTALTPLGEKLLAEMTTTAFRGTIDEWRKKIDTYLANG